MRIPKEKLVKELSDEQIEEIAERAADKAVAKLTDKVYREVGKGILKKLIWILGALGSALYLWVTKDGGNNLWRH